LEALKQSQMKLAEQHYKEQAAARQSQGNANQQQSSNPNDAEFKEK